MANDARQFGDEARVLLLVGVVSTAFFAIALVGQAVLFGVGHLYVGPAGGINAAFGALVFGAFFLLAGRNLWPVILVHGAWDTLGIVLLYARGTTTI